MSGVATQPGPFTRSLPPWVAPAAAIAVGLVACAYIAAVDPNHSSAYPQCPTKLLTGLDCPMCGATRAVHSLLHGDVVGAMDHNLLFVLLVPAFAYAFVAWTATRLGHPLKPIPMSSPWLSVPLTIVIVAFTIVRNLPMQPYHWLNSATSR
jgi:Protein of unknown function (DUF2752)